jgi:transposase-like protein
MARRIISQEFKVEADRLARERGVSVAQAARDLDIHENMLRRWAKERTADPAQSFPGRGRSKERACLLVVQYQVRALARPEVAVWRRAKVSSLEPIGRKQTRLTNLPPSSASTVHGSSRGRWQAWRPP